MKTKIHNISLMAALLFVITANLSHAQSMGWLSTDKKEAVSGHYVDTNNWLNGEINGVFGTNLTAKSWPVITFTNDFDIVEDTFVFAYPGEVLFTFRGEGTNVTATLKTDLIIQPTTSKGSVAIGSTTANQNLSLDLDGGNRTIKNKQTVYLRNQVSNGALTLNGSSTVEINGSNTISGGVYLKSGGLKLSNQSALGTGVFEIGDTEGSTAVTLDSGVGNLVNIQNNPQIWNQDFTFSGSQNLNLGTGAVTLTGDRTVTVNGNTRVLTIGGPIDGPYSLTQSGAGTLSLNGANTYSGGTIINAGKVQFGSGAVPGTGMILINSSGALNVGGAYSTPQEWLESGKIDKASTGVLALTGNNADSIDFNSSGYSNLSLGASTAANYTGALTPWNGVYRLGGGGATLTLSEEGTLTGDNRAEIGEPGASTATAATVQFTVPQHLTGPTLINEGNKLLLTGTDGSLSASSVAVNKGATLELGSTANFAGAIRAPEVTLCAATLSVKGNKYQDSVETITGNVIVSDAPVGGVSFITVDADAKGVQLYAGELVRTNSAVGVVNGDKLGDLPGAGVGNFFVDTPPALVGGNGSEGPTSLSIVPWLVGASVAGSGGNASYIQTLITYEAERGFRPLDLDTEFTNQVDSGSVTWQNVRVPNGTTWTLTDDTSINALLLQGSDPNKVATKVSGEGTLTVRSGLVVLGYHRNASPSIEVPLDFGDAQGVIIVPQGKGSTISKPISGSGGLVLVQASTGIVSPSGGTGVSLSESNTYTGDTYIYAYQSIGDNALPSGNRTGDVYVYGILGVSSPKINGLYGTGTISKGNYSGTMTLGDNDADGNFEGTITQGGALSIVKIGNGTQRLGGKSIHSGATTINGGTLIMDGSFISAVTVNEGATLAGAGTIDKSGTSLTVKDGGILQPGSTNGVGTLTVAGNIVFAGDATLKVLADRSATGAISVGGAVTGAGTISVEVTGEKPGKWLILEAASIEPTFESVTPGVIVTVEAGGTQVWAERLNPATVIVIR